MTRPSPNSASSAARWSTSASSATTGKSSTCRPCRRLRRPVAAGRRHPRHGGRLRLLPRQLQPRDPGLAPAGSNIKPFIYAASLERGLTPATQISDLPFELSAAQTGSKAWTPKNYGNQYEPMLTLRQGLYKSKNMVSIRILQAIGPQYGQDYLTRFGFDKARQPAVLLLALGAGSVTPLQVAGAYAVFANGGYRITPYLIDRVTDSNGKVIMQSKPVVAGDAAARAIDPRTAWIMDDILRGVATYGTAARARAAQAQRHRRQDRHHQRIGGRLVLGLHALAGGDLVAGLRPAQVAGLARDRRRRRHADLGGLHADRAQGRARGKAAPRPDGIIVENGEYYFSEFPPGQAVARLGLPQADTLGEFLNGLGGGGEDNSIKVAPGVGAQATPLVAEDTVLIVKKPALTEPAFHGRAAARRVFASGRAAASREARAADGAMPRGNGYRRIVTGTPAAAEQICDSASGSCGPPACHSSAGRRSDNGTRRCAPRPTAPAWRPGCSPPRGCCLRTPSSAHCRCGWSRHRHRAKPPSHRPGFRCCSAPGRSTQKFGFGHNRACKITEFPVSQLAYSRMALRIVATLVATGLVAACGYKGPLYMPTPDGKPPSTAKQQKQQQPIIPPAPRCPDAPGRHAPGQPGAADNKSPRMGLLLAQSRPIRAGRRNAGPTGTCSRPGRRSR